MAVTLPLAVGLAGYGATFVGYEQCPGVLCVLPKPWGQNISVCATHRATAPHPAPLTWPHGALLGTHALVAIARAPVPRCGPTWGRAYESTHCGHLVWNKAPGHTGWGCTERSECCNPSSRCLWLVWRGNLSVQRGDTCSGLEPLATTITPPPLRERIKCLWCSGPCWST